MFRISNSKLHSLSSCTALAWPQTAGNKWAAKSDEEPLQKLVWEKNIELAIDSLITGDVGEGNKKSLSIAISADVLEPQFFPALAFQGDQFTCP
jgi:hypothetical protein